LGIFKSLIVSEGGEGLNIMPSVVENVMENKAGMSFSFVAGLILKESKTQFKKMLFRKMRGNLIMEMRDLERPIETFDKKLVEKTLYVVIIRETEQLRSAVLRICEAFSSEMYLL